MRRLVLKCVWSLPGGCDDKNNNLDENAFDNDDNYNSDGDVVTMMPVMMTMTTALKLGQFEACLSDRIETMPWAL